jgi:hypothetical protein
MMPPIDAMQLRMWLVIVPVSEPARKPAVPASVHRAALTTSPWV